VRIVFLGTPAFAVPSLEALIAAGYRVEAVFTQPDRPKGRGQALAQSPVKEAALSHGLPVRQPERIRRPESVEFLRQVSPPLMVVVGYGQIIPQSIIDIPKHGILNVHASLLPKYRGAAPIQWAIANGETTTGVTIMRIDAGLDTGDMLRKAEASIGPEETAPELSGRLAVLGAGLLIEAIKDIEAGLNVPQKQNNAEATLAPILKKEDGLADWTRPAAVTFNRLRGFTPWPGLNTVWRGQPFAITHARVAPESLPNASDIFEPGTLVAHQKRLFVSCGEGTSLELLEVQIPGKKRMPAAAFLNGYHLTEYERFE
jgi:methionyl-tRNA formyltransferase